jgi:hypothetical protein
MTRFMAGRPSPRRPGHPAPAAQSYAIKRLYVMRAPGGRGSAMRACESPMRRRPATGEDRGARAEQLIDVIAASRGPRGHEPLPGPPSPRPQLFGGRTGPGAGFYRRTRNGRKPIPHWFGVALLCRRVSASSDPY